LSTERCDSHYGVACLGMVGHQCPLPNPSNNNNNKNNTFAIANDNAHTPKNPKPYITHCHPHFQTPPHFPNPIRCSWQSPQQLDRQIFTSEVFLLSSAQKPLPPTSLPILQFLYIHTYTYIFFSMPRILN